MYRFIKRAFDILIGIFMLVVTSPILLVAMLCVYIEDPGPVIFKQQRIGYKAKEYTIFKLRTMRQNSEHTGTGVYSEEDDPRLLKTGRIFRMLSIDELPQSLHLISGKMSLIGPRPPLTYHPWPIEQYTKEQLHMFDVRPGMTGWAQVNGRKTVEWNHRIELNCWYADNVSFALDCKIIYKTLIALVKHSDNVNVGETLKK